MRTSALFSPLCFERLQARCSLIYLESEAAHFTLYNPAAALRPLSVPPGDQSPHKLQRQLLQSDSRRHCGDTHVLTVCACPVESSGENSWPKPLQQNHSNASHDPSLPSSLLLFLPVFFSPLYAFSIFNPLIIFSLLLYRPLLLSFLIVSFFFFICSIRPMLHPLPLFSHLHLSFLSPFPPLLLLFPLSPLLLYFLHPSSLPSTPPPLPFLISPLH